MELSGFGAGSHVAGFHFGYLFLTHSHFIFQDTSQQLSRFLKGSCSRECLDLVNCCGGGGGCLGSKKEVLRTVANLSMELQNQCLTLWRVVEALQACAFSSTRPGQPSKVLRTEVFRLQTHTHTHTHTQMRGRSRARPRTRTRKRKRTCTPTHTHISTPQPIDTSPRRHAHTHF